MTDTSTKPKREAPHMLPYCGNRFSDALFVQGAVNLRAIARLLVSVADEVDSEAHSTEAVWNDAAVILIVSKLDSLVHSSDHFSKAYDICQRNQFAKDGAPTDVRS